MSPVILANRKGSSREEERLAETEEKLRRKDGVMADLLEDRTRSRNPRVRRRRQFSKPKARRA